MNVSRTNTKKIYERPIYVSLILTFLTIFIIIPVVEMRKLRFREAVTCPRSPC